jgi:ERCC4-type nuclease
MIIKIDMRERELIDEVTKLLPSYENIELKVENLPLGDMILCEGEKDYVLFERKTVADLAASIKDGRYEEQSFRLNGLPMPNHNILYLIEGNIQNASSSATKFKGNFKFKPASSFNSIQPATIYSALFSLNFFKGFSVVRTNDLTETAIFLCNSAAKLRKDLLNGKQPFFPDSQNGEKTAEVAASSSSDYVNVVKKVKKENICKENIGEIMLCQIPGVSSVTGKTIMAQFKSIEKLVEALKENPNVLQGLQTTTANGQKRKISKTSCAKITYFLLDGENGEEEHEDCDEE